jgi:micrococcal nuclease
LLPTSAPAKTEIVTGRVVGVHDGDSITVLAAGKVQLKVRLEGIDAPELKQPFSQQSKEALSRLVFGKTVALQVTGRDRYKRTLAVVVADGVNVNRELVRLGLAWRYEAYSKDTALLAAQNEAKAAKRGLWRDPGAVGVAGEGEGEAMISARKRSLLKHTFAVQFSK